MNYHGVDLHKNYATISVRDEAGKEQSFARAQADLPGYLAKLGSQDAGVLEASSGALYWAERIQKLGARCAVIDAYRFRIIRDSWQKTDKRDAANLSLALWMASKSGEMKLPEVWQPGPVIRELRRLFGMYELWNKQIRQLKNQIHGVLLDNGVRDRALGTRLISIRGVTPLLALGFLAEVGDIRRFSSARKLHSYLGVVPTVRSSGGVTRNGAINRPSRGLTRSLFTQAAIHLVDSSPVLGRFYRGLVDRKGYGRARIALLRKTFSMMRRMLLSGQPYRWVEPRLHMQKLRDFQRELMKDRSPQAA